MLDTLNAIMHVNFATMLIVSALVVVSAVIFRETTDSNMMTAFFVPIATFGALTFIYVLSRAGIFFTTQKDANSAVSSGLGIIAALLIMMAAIRACSMIGDMRRAPDPAGRLLDKEPGT